MNNLRTTPFYLLIILSMLFSFATCVDINAPSPEGGFTNGMPSETVLNSFGLFDFYDLDLSGASKIGYKKGAETLEIKFDLTDETIEAIKDYFSKGWVSGGDDGTEFNYFRGFEYETYVTFSTSEPFFLYISRDIKGITVEEEWPSDDLLEEFKVEGLPYPNDAEHIAYIRKDNTLYISFINEIDPADKDDFIKSYTDYFKGIKWTFDSKESNVGVSNYSYLSGYSTVNFYAELYPYYEIYIYMNEDVEGEDGWPSIIILNDFGLYKMHDSETDLTGIDITSALYVRSHDMEDDVLSISFQGTSATFGYFETYFNTWVEAEGSGIEPNSLQYTRGFAFVSFSFPDFSDNHEGEYYLYVNMPRIPVNVDGWPASAVLTEYGVAKLTDPQPTYALEHVTHSAEHIIAPPENATPEEKANFQPYSELKIRFMADSAGALSGILAKFNDPDNNWTDTTDYTTTSNPGIDMTGRTYYQKALYRVEINAYSEPFYEIIVTKDDGIVEGEEGWPTPELLKEFGIYEFAKPADATAVFRRGPFVELSAEGDSDVLEIRFTDITMAGTANTAIEAYFASTAPTVKWNKQDVDPYTTQYTRGVTSVSYSRPEEAEEFEYTLSIAKEKDLVINDGWPGDNDKLEFGIPDWPTLSGAKNAHYVLEDKGITILFEGTALTESNISSYFGTSWTPYDPELSDPRDPILDDPTYDPIYDKMYERGISFVVVDTRLNVYFYEIYIYNVKHPLSEDEWPKEDLLQKYGLHGYDQPDVTKGYETLFHFIEVDSISNDESLVIQFYGNAADESDIIAYFTDTDNHWGKPKDEFGVIIPDPLGEIHFQRGITSVQFDTKGSPSYTITVSTSTEGTQTWPAANTLKEYGLHGLTTSQPPGITFGTQPDRMVWHIAGDDETGADRLAIRFYGTAETQSAISGYFDLPANNWERILDSKDEFGNVIETFPLTEYHYQRGIAYVVFDTSESPYYEIISTIDYREGHDADSGWPSNALLAKWLPSFAAPTEKDRPSYREITKDPSATPPIAEGFELGFYGTDAYGSDLLRYFDEYWKDVVQDPASPEYVPNVYHYERFGKYAVVDVADKPYYFIEVDEIYNGIPGWPTDDILEYYGLHWITDPSFDPIEILYDINRTLNELTIIFSDNTPTKTKANSLKAYFSNTANNWTRMLNSKDDFGNVIETFPLTEHHYSRGIAYAIFDDSDPLKTTYQILVTRATVEDSLPDWPGDGYSDGLKEFGLHDFPVPAAQDAVNVSHNISIPNNELVMRFYEPYAKWGVPTPVAEIKDYFDLRANNWERIFDSKDDFGTTIETFPETEYHYSRGIAYVVFDTSEEPYYEITVTRTIDGISDWPSTFILEYGLHGLTQPTAAQIVHYKIEGEKQKELTMRFYGTPATESAVFGYFGAIGTPANNWAMLEKIQDYDEDGNPKFDQDDNPVMIDVPAGEYHYQRGITYVVFDTKESPYYEIATTRTLDGTQGWPVPDLLAQFGLQGLAKPTGITAEVPTLQYILNNVTNELAIQFYGTLATESAVDSYFTTSNWTRIYDSRDVDDNIIETYPLTEHHYQRGIAYVVFDTSESPFYEIYTSRSASGTTGWPNTELLGSFGLNKLTQPAPGTSNVMHFHEVDDLAIRFSGTTANRDAILAYFAESSGWSKPKDTNGDPIPDPSGEYHFVRGIATVVFYTVGAPYYEIVVTRDVEGVPDWPSDTLLKEYGLHGLSAPTTTTTYSHFVDEGIDENNEPYEALVIRFYGSEDLVDPAEAEIRAYFENGTWDAGAGTAFTSEYSRGIASVIFDTAGKPYYELYVSRYLPGEAGWPSNTDLLKSYGIPDMTSAVWPVGSELMHIRNDIDEEGNLIIQFYGEPSNWLFLKTYFDNVAHNWILVASLDGVYDYTRGITSVGVDTSTAPYYELFVSIEIEGDEGWPGDDLKTKYGIDDITWPSNAYNITHAEEEGVDDNDEPYAGLVIRFFGTATDGQDISDYLSVSNGWEFLDTSSGISNYYRGIAYVSFNTGSSPYYEMYVSLSGEFVPGWPVLGTLESFGLHGMAAVIPLDAPAADHSIDGDELSIVFSDASVGSVILAYFNLTANNWTKETTDADENALTAGTYRYTRGISDVTITVTGIYYTITASRYIDEGFETGWPLSSVLSTYGLFGMTQPLGTSPTTIWHKAGTEIDDETGVEYATFTIQFYGFEFVTDGDAILYFESNGWNNVTPSATEPNVFHYSRGVAYLVFDASEKPYYEIMVTIEAEGTPGWPLSSVLDSFGLPGITLPSRQDMNITHALLDANSLVMQFYGTSADVSAIRNYFEASNWSIATADGIYAYERGITTVTINTSTPPYYIIEVERNVDELTQGWPSTALLLQYGASDLYFPTTVPNAYVWHSESTETDGSKTLDIHFFEASQLNEERVKTYFTTGNWTLDQENSSGQIYVYERGVATGYFDAESQPYYSLEFSMGDPGTPGWPGTLLNSYGLFGMTTTAPAGAVSGTIYHSIGNEVDQETGDVEDSLTIRFDGLPSTANVITTWFNNNNWVKDVDLTQGSTTNTYYKSKGIASVVRFDTTTAPSYLLYVERDTEGNVAGWPLAAKLQEYGLYNLPARPTTMSTLIWYEEEEDPNEGDTLTIKFYGPATTATTRTVFEGTTATGIRSLFPTTNTATGCWTIDSTALAGTYAFERGISHVTIDTTNWPYYEIHVSKEAGATSGWPAAGILLKHGVSGLNTPTTANLASYVANSTFYVDGEEELIITFHTTAAVTTINNHRTQYFSTANGWTADTAASNAFPYSKGSISVEYSSTKTYFHMITVEKLGEPGLPALNDPLGLDAFKLTGLTVERLEGLGVKKDSIRYVAETGYLAILFEGTASSGTEATALESAIVALLQNPSIMNPPWEMEALTGTGTAAYYPGSIDNATPAPAIRHIDFYVGTRPYYKIEVDK